MSDDNPKTPSATPSAMHRLGLVLCPKCRGTRLLCDLCAEAGMVAVDIGIAWSLEHGGPASEPGEKPEEPGKPDPT